MMLVVFITLGCKPSTPTYSISEASPEISISQAKELVQSTPNLKILDVRTPEEYAEGHLDRALNINFRDPNFENQIKALQKEDTYLVYCKSGGRSAKAVELMKELKFTQVSDMTDGYSSYAKSK